MKLITLAALWGLAGASPAPIQNLTSRDACPFKPEDSKPLDIPEGAYESGAHNLFYPMGEQQGKVLMNEAPRIMDLNDEGQGAFPRSKSFVVALKRCTRMCETDTRCKSINILVVVEEDLNRCQPTWQCRFADKLYDPADYKVAKGVPSYIWSRSPPAPDCSFSKTSDVTPATWNARNMGGYLSTLATQLGIMGESRNFVSRLMDPLGYSPYTCTGPNLDQCPDVDRISKCGDWVNYQNRNFQTFARNNIRLLDNIVQNLQTIGQDIFMRSCLVGLVPMVGRGAKVGIEKLEQLYAAQQSSHPIGVTPRNVDSWAAFMGTEAQQVTQSSRFLTDVLAGGSWSVPDPQSQEFMINVEAFWPQAEKYYAAKVAMEALRAQSVFLMTRFIGRDKCTQQDADMLAADINKGPKGVAFCHVGYAMVPVMGWNQRVYDTWGSMVSAAKSSSPEVISPSISCESGMRTGHPLYHNDAQTAKIGVGGQVKYKLQAPCTWSIPICEVSVWRDLSKNWKGNPISDHKPEGYQKNVNALYSCAYNWGMIDKIKWCGNFKAMTTQGGSMNVPQCKDWRPAKEPEARIS